ncbi:hypothetical protein D3C72_1878580 [compost metagenome]
MRARQAGDHATHIAFVILDGDAAMHVHDLVVPRGHLLVLLVLAGIPVRRDVGVSGAEHDQHFAAVGDLAPHRVVAGHVAVQDGALAHL